MVTQKVITDYLNKNVSYVFTVSLYDTIFNNKLSDHIVNTYFYNDKDDYLSVILHKISLPLLEESINTTSTKWVDKIAGYIDHNIQGNYIIVKLDKSVYIDKNAITHLESSNYNEMKNSLYYKNIVSKQTDKFIDIQKQIIDQSENLKLLLELKYNTDVNGYWEKFDIEKETLTLQKIIDMNTNLEIQKSWLMTKIANADSLSKIAYQDVWDNSKEIKAPEIIGLTIKTESQYETIYNNVKEALIKKCGKPQYNIEIHGTKYPLMCNFIDFKNKLMKVIKKYKLEDMNKIEKVLIDHVTKLKSPLLKYYILKDDNSNLASDYELYVESKEISKPQSFEI